ncbi:MAG TPA: 16S rRNA (cytosine(1402)-N(4))-methyltransferase RsmH [Anaerolineaceae bacterium]
MAALSEPESSQRPPHQSVLYQEILYYLRPHSPERYIDGTLGAGGHAWGILQAAEPNGELLGLDLDPQALALAGQRLAVFNNRATIVQASYTTLLDQMQANGWENVAGVLLDLGVSSMQLDTPDRGFSFQSNGPLDMRFSPQIQASAADLVNTLPEAQLAEILFRYGEERLSRRIARAIVQARPLHTTHELAEVVRRAAGKQSGHIHPATRTFQALRIAVNGELAAIETVLPQAVQALKPGGRLAVISFHSLEDRIVKHYFRRESRDCICPPEQPVCTCGHVATLVEITRKPVEAGPEEIEQNPRARSARLRVAEKK